MASNGRNDLTKPFSVALPPATLAASPIVLKLTAKLLAVRTGIVKDPTTSPAEIEIL